jgi:N utilization substance protein B
MTNPAQLDELIKQPSQEIEEDEAPASPRTQARRVALQALYQWLVNHDEVYTIEKQFFEEGLLSGLDRDWFKELLNEVANQSQALDGIYGDYLDRNIKLINPVERTILRMATYELQTQLQIPYKVVINEAIELSKRFGAEDAHKYINGVLDKVAKQLRPIEFSV